jgi:hypothetical protein
LLDGGCSLTFRVRQAVSGETLAILRGRGLLLTEAPAVGICALQLDARRPPFQEKALRQSIRDVFLGLLQADAAVFPDIKVDASFLPKGAMGYLPLKAPARPRPLHSRGGIVRVLFASPRPSASPADNKTQQAVARALFKALRLHGLRPEAVERGIGGPKVRDLDCEAVLATFGVFVNDPYADLRRMFMSRVGLCFPAPAGPLAGMIQRGEASTDPAERRRLAERINARVFEEAFLIAYAHTGLIYISDPGVDLSHFNLFLDPIDLRAIGWRPKRPILSF